MFGKRLFPLWFDEVLQLRRRMLHSVFRRKERKDMHGKLYASHKHPHIAQSSLEPSKPSTQSQSCRGINFILRVRQCLIHVSAITLRQGTTLTALHRRVFTVWPRAPSDPEVTGVATEAVATVDSAQRPPPSQVWPLTQFFSVSIL